MAIASLPIVFRSSLVPRLLCGGGRESLVSIVCACTNFSEIFRNPDTSLRTSVMLNTTTRVPPLSLDAAVTFSLGKLGLAIEGAALTIYERKEVFVYLSTGYGKSLCYLPSLCHGP